MGSIGNSVTVPSIFCPAKYSSHVREVQLFSFVCSFALASRSYILPPTVRISRPRGENTNEVMIIGLTCGFEESAPGAPSMVCPLRTKYFAPMLKISRP